MNVKLSTTSLIDLKLNYRLPKEYNSNNHHNPVLSVYIPARGLLVECNFPSESAFNEFKNQNEDYINSGIIVIGEKVKGESLENKSKDMNKKILDNVKSKFDKSVNNITDMAKEAKINMTINTDKL